MLRKFLLKIYDRYFGNLVRISLWPGEYDAFVYLDVYTRLGSYSISCHPLKVERVKKIPDSVL